MDAIHELDLHSALLISLDLRQQAQIQPVQVRCLLQHQTHAVVGPSKGKLGKPPDHIPPSNVALLALQLQFPLHRRSLQQPDAVTASDGGSGGVGVKAAQIGSGKAPFFRGQIRIHNNHLKIIYRRTKKTRPLTRGRKIGGIALFRATMRRTIDKSAVMYCYVNTQKGRISMLQIKALTKRYGEKCAVDHLDLHIRPGELCAFIGHNGAGKTTTLKVCCGILDFDEGDILIGGKSIRTEPLACKQQLAYVPDNPDLYEFMTGTAYLNFICDVYGMGQKERLERIQKYTRLLELEGQLDQPISAFSHGMKQKLALIAALSHEPKLILLDEPFVGLDPKASHELKEVMQEHCRSGGAIFFSTHVLEVAEKLCDRVAIIQNGRLVRAGTMEEVRGDASLEDVFLELEDDHAVETH